MKSVIVVLCIAIHFGTLPVLFAAPMHGDIPYDECGFGAALRAHLARYEAGDFSRRPRPVLSGPVAFVVKPHVRVHYTTAGGDATTPAYAESVAVYAEHCWAVFTGLGWLRPPPDQGVGGDDRYDIYIRSPQNIGAYGVCVPDSLYSDPYPNGRSSWVEVTRDSIPQPFPRYARLRALMAHELHHAFQARYVFFDQIWIYENTAVYAEGLAYDDVKTIPYRLNHGRTPLANPELPVNHVGPSGADTLYWYSGAIWPMFLHECYGIGCPRRVWERIGERGTGAIALAEINWVLNNTYRSGLSEALKNYAVWRYFTGQRADTVHYFRESHLWPESHVLHTHSSYPASGDQRDRAPSGPGGTNFIQFRSGTEDMLEVAFDGQDNASWAAQLVGYRSPEQSVQRGIALDASQRGTGRIAWQETDHLALITTVTVTLTPPNLTHSYSALQRQANLWHYTGSLARGRCGHSTTLLTDGKLLVAGGWNTSSIFSVCEVYSPASGSWSSTGSLRQARDAHRATRLLDGRVLVAAGSHWGDLRSSELYDPTVGSWAYTGALTKGRHSPELVTLDDGRALVVGGTRAGWTCEVYDLNTGNWSITDSIRDVGRGLSDFTLTVLPSGRVLLAGGRTEATGQIWRECQVYDPSTGLWSNASAMNHGRAWHRAVLLPDGQVLVVGGKGTSGDLTACELYDEMGDNWRLAGSLNTARRSQSMSLLSDGRVIVLGGEAGSIRLRSAEVSDARLTEWSYVDSLRTARTGLSASQLPDGSVIAIAGYPNISSCELLVLSPARPQIWTRPKYVSLAVQPHQQRNTFAGLFNNGDTTLQWSLAENPPVNWLSVTPTSGTVPPRPNNRMDLTLSFNAAALDTGFHHTNLVFSSNDPDQPVKHVSVELYVRPSYIRVLPPVALDSLGTGFAETPAGEALPTVFALGTGYPSPFVSQTAISYALPHTSPVELRVYNPTGVLVRTLRSGFEQAGYHRAVWDGRDDTGNRVGRGVYYYRLTAGDFTATRKLVKTE